MAAGRFIAWAAAGMLFMLGCITPAGFLLWIPAAALATLLIVLKIRSPRYIFAFITGIGVTLISLGIINGTYVVMILYGSVLTAGGIVFFSAFGPRTSHADPPSGS
ncbi:MAG: hypothetical protein KDB52_09585 [Solirubrobacterales bacterium]|nr:hypothetical protein [Solirubrobacterales bacterium]